MNYIELINNFWRKDAEYCFSEKATALYFYLLNINNVTGWKAHFGQSNAVIAAKFGWGKSSFNTAKNDLKRAGLIDFKQGDGRGNVYRYEIKGVKKGASNEPLSDTLSGTLYRTLSDPKPATSINNKLNEIKPNNSPPKVPPGEECDSKKKLNVPFEAFWGLYDKKVGSKEKLQKKWAKLKPGEREAIMEYLPAYKIARPDKQYRKDPATFLNNRSWEDELIQSTQNGTGVEKRNSYSGKGKKDLSRLKNLSGAVMEAIEAGNIPEHLRE